MLECIRCLGAVDPVYAGTSQLHTTFPTPFLQSDTPSGAGPNLGWRGGGVEGWRGGGGRTSCLWRATLGRTLLDGGVFWGWELLFGQQTEGAKSPS